MKLEYKIVLRLNLKFGILIVPLGDEVKQTQGVKIQEVEYGIQNFRYKWNL